MKIQKEIIDNIWIFHLTGRLDVKRSEIIKENIRNGLAEKINRFIFDLSAIEMIDSSGLGTLVASQRILLNHSGKLYIASIPEQLRSIFELTHSYRVFKIFPDVHSALQHFNQHPNPS